MDHTSTKVSELLQPPLQQPPPFADLPSYLAAALPTKLPVPEAMYHRLVTLDSALAHVIEPLSVSGAEALATLIGSALDSEEFVPTDEITIGGESFVARIMRPVKSMRPVTISRSNIEPPCRAC